MVLQILAKRNNEWRRMAKKFSPSPDDVLQDMYLKLYDRFKDCPEKVQAMHPNQVAMYCYLTIRSIAIELHKQPKTVQITEAIEPDEYDTEADQQTEDKLEAIQAEINSWCWYDQKLFNIYTQNEGMTYRAIEKTIGISVSSAFGTIKNCKQKLKNAI
jgi:RNA polymerase sigma factor (sigma-70 family)